MEALSLSRGIVLTGLQGFNEKTMSKRSGTADMALWDGGIPGWLFSRMKELALPMVQTLLLEHGQKEFLRRLSDPFWFQSSA